MKTAASLSTGALGALLLGLAVSPTVAAEENPYALPDGTWVSLSGRAIDARADAFTLDYGDGTVLVEMDDWDWYEESGEVLEGDKVTVYGEIDDSFFDTARVEAGSVYVENLGTYFYQPSAADEEGAADELDSWITADPIEVGDVDVRGEVTGVNDESFTIDTGYRQVTVDTSELGYDPLDEKGFISVDKGDYVSVSAELESDFFDSGQIQADYLVVLEND